MNILCSIVLALHVIQPNVVHANSKASLENKRLLLNDPDVTYSRLSNVEKSIQDMIGLTQQLQKQNSNMQTTIAHLEATLVKETSKRLDLQTELTKETHKTSGMQLTISQLQTELSQEKVKVSLALSHGRYLQQFVFYFYVFFVFYIGFWNTPTFTESVHKKYQIYIHWLDFLCYRWEGTKSL